MTTNTPTDARHPEEDAAALKRRHAALSEENRRLRCLAERQHKLDKIKRGEAF